MAAENKNWRKSDRTLYRPPREVYAAEPKSRAIFR